MSDYVNIEVEFQKLAKEMLDELNLKIQNKVSAGELNAQEALSLQYMIEDRIEDNLHSNPNRGWQSSDCGF